MEIIIKHIVKIMCLSYNFGRKGGKSNILVKKSSPLCNFEFDGLSLSGSQTITPGGVYVCVYVCVCV